MENINIQSFSINSTPKILHTLPSLFKAKIIDGTTPPAPKIKTFFPLKLKSKL